MFPRRSRVSHLQVHLDLLAIEIATNPVAFFNLMSKIGAKEPIDQLIQELLKADYRMVLEHILSLPSVPDWLRLTIVSALAEDNAKPSALEWAVVCIVADVKCVALLTRSLVRFAWLAVRTGVSLLTANRTV